MNKVTFSKGSSWFTYQIQLSFLFWISYNTLYHLIVCKWCSLQLRSHKVAKYHYCITWCGMQFEIVFMCVFEYQCSRKVCVFEIQVWEERKVKLFICPNTLYIFSHETLDQIVKIFRHLLFIHHHLEWGEKSLLCELNAFKFTL